MEGQDEYAPLRRAMLDDQPEVAQSLLEAAGANLSNREKLTSVFLEAVEKPLSFLPVVEGLVSKGASVNGRDKDGNSALHLVKTLGMAKSLMRFHPDVNAANNDGLTPLHEAVTRGNVQLTQFLLMNGADANLNASRKYDLRTPLHIATDCDRKDIVTLLLQNKALVNSKCREGTPLHIACKIASTEMVRLLLDNEADVEATDTAGKTPVYRAIENVDRHALIVRSLLDKGAVLKPTPGLLYAALRHKCPELIEILIEHGCDVNEKVKGRTPLHFTVSSLSRGEGADGLKIVQLLLANGAHVNAQIGKTGQTAMSLAIKNEFFEVVPILLEFGAEYPILPHRNTLLHLVAQARVSAHTLTALLKRGGDVNARNSAGDTPLHSAVFNYETLSPLRALLSWPDVDMDARNKHGDTALCAAASAMHKNAVLTLLEFGADVNIKGREGLTPVELAERHRSRSPMGDTIFMVSMALRSHVARLKCADLPVSEENLTACKTIVYPGEDESPENTDNTLDDPVFVQYCKDEVEKMKNKRIGKSCVSYYDILSQSSRQVAKHAKNPAVSCGMDSEGSLVRKFFMYGRWINVRYRRAKRRAQLQEKAISSLMDMFEFLPLICCSLITDFLSNQDLKNCCDCCPELDD